MIVYALIPQKIAMSWMVGTMSVTGIVMVAVSDARIKSIGTTIAPPIHVSIR